MWRTQAPLKLPKNSFTIPAASRADLAVRCTADSYISIGGARRATIAVEGKGNPNPHPFAADGTGMWSAQRPTYLQDLRHVDASQVQADVKIRTRKDSINIKALQGHAGSSQYDPDVPLITKSVGAVQEWFVTSSTEEHPFHLHVYHMQPQAHCAGVVSNADIHGFEEGEFYDVIVSTPRRQQNRNIGGKPPVTHMPRHSESR